MAAVFARSRACVALLAATAALALVPPVEAHFSSGQYSHRRGDCASRVDPIGAVFYGPAPSGAPAYTDNLAGVVDHLEAHTGWWDPALGSGQWFATHGYCAYWDGERASGGAAATRHHIRLRRTFDWDPALGYTTVGTPHYEIATSCGHAVRETRNGISGYDIARQRLVDTLGVAHPHRVEAWGNTQRFVQCNGWLAQSNGNVRYFAVPAWWHSSRALAPGPTSRRITRQAPVRVRPRGNLSLGAATLFRRFPLYFLGASFRRLPLTAVDDAGTNVGFLYGTCVLDASARRCPVPVEIQVWPRRERSAGMYAFEPDEELRLRGIPAAFYEGRRRLELYRRNVTVVIFGRGRAELVAVAAALRRVGGTGVRGRLR
jgi:hypothetical protein